MTDRFNSIVVALEDDIREDDAEAIMSAILQLRGVIKVSGNVSNIDSWTADGRAKHKLGMKLWAIINDKEML